MISKNKIKYIQSLALKKKRKEENAFLAEGPKIVTDLLENFVCRTLVATEEWLKRHPHIQLSPKLLEIIPVNHDELSRASLLKTPQEVLAVFSTSSSTFDSKLIEQSLCLALDGIQDPGNLGTILRIADWFGIEHVLCSADTVDVYNPKVVQATMGAIARVQVHYCDLHKVIKDIQSKGIPTYGTFLNGENIYEQSLSSNGLIVMGNEGNGISPVIGNLIGQHLLIPNYPSGRKTGDSLNVAIATAVICAEFRRRAM